MAYALGQILDVNVFNRLRQNRRWYVAPAAAMFVGNLIDTLAFFFIAFWRSTDPFMAANWVEIARWITVSKSLSACCSSCRLTAYCLI